MATDDRLDTSSQELPENWARTELESIDFGDERLSKRAQKLLQCCYENPQASIPQASGGDWARTKAAYRFINNPKVRPENIFAPHAKASLKRFQGHPVILAIQDTTELNFTAHKKTKGLGSIGSRPYLRGMHVHTTITFSPARVPLGIIDQQSWVRAEEDYGKSAERRQRPIEKKESFKWLKSLEATERVQNEQPDSVFVNVGDREADIYDLFRLASGMKSKLLVRASWNRGVEHDEKYLWEHLEAQDVSATLEMVVPLKKQKKTRTATIEVRFAPVTICAPRKRRHKEPPVELYSVYINEANPPEGVEALSWMLLTTLPVATTEEALKIVEYYSCRWQIEVFHRVLKSGCKIEKRQLQTAAGLRNCLAIDSLVAWRILQLTMLGRETPNVPCDVVFEDYEWKALYCYVHKTTEPPKKPPPLKEAVVLVARIGGFLARKSDGFPGTTVLWRGLQQLTTISFAWFAFGPGRPEP